MEYFLVFFFPKQLHAALILAYISSFVVSLRFVFCPRYLNSVTFSIFVDLLVCLHNLLGLSCTLSFLCVFLSQLSDFLSSHCLSVFSICLVVSLKRATSSASLKLVKFLRRH